MWQKFLWKTYWKIEGLLVPEMGRLQPSYGAVLRSCLDFSTTWLDLGCGHALLPTWLSTEEKALSRNCRCLIGIDYDMASLMKHRTLDKKIRGDITELPLKTSSLELITSNMVVEHLKDPLSCFREVNRVLKPGGLFVLHTPNILAYPALISLLIPEKAKRKMIRVLQGRKDEDVFRTYYRANSRYKLAELARRSNFMIRRLDLLVGHALFPLITPLAVLELMWTRLLMISRFEGMRPNIVAALQKRRGR